MEITSNHSIVHGMHNDLVQADWPALTTAEITGVLTAYGIASTQMTILWNSPRPFSAGCAVQTAQQTLFIKRHHPAIRTVATLSEEHRFIRHLHDAGLPVSRPLTTPSGTTAAAVSAWTYEVFVMSDAHDLYRDALSWTPFTHTHHAFAAGKMLARLHNAAQGYAAPARHHSILSDNFALCGEQDLLAAMQATITSDPVLSSWLASKPWQEQVRTHLLPWHQALQPFLPELPRLWTHNDWHASNLLWTTDSDDADVAVVFDFGLCNRTCALRDLALAIERNVIGWLDMDKSDTIVKRDQLSALLDGYISVRPMSQWDWHALAALMPLAHVEFALSELAYFHGITHSEANATLAWDGYLIGHARWFAHDEGQALLSFLKHRKPSR